MLAPQTSGYASGPGFPSFTIPQSIPAYLSTPNKPETPLPSGSTFRAPAHKHAHHLHSIPPREKRRTRFAQARAELGMTDRTGGPSSPNYAHRRRPENYEEDADENSEGEEPERLKSRTGDPRRIPANDEEDRLNSQDLPLARSLRLRAEGLEKVVTSMLAQPPAFHPTNDDDIWTPPTSPEIIATNQPHHNPHTLPNGVRLRLALGTIINDLFARQAPPPPYRHHIHSKSPSESPADSPTSSTPTELPAALKTLSVVSATNTLPHSLSRRPSPSANIPGYGSQSVSSLRDRPPSHLTDF
ncbi:hypothetical protein H0H81_005825 [Sphagnurus paluster]|uniref:Uncharacterized protein n=1 Tax=Sphagnurus paluster TaxID=117069 RepID=A0A9P7GLV5_9AGAR|nr:hypothetical protein H0H81_005825 [Sphagnurus paluster]